MRAQQTRRAPGSGNIRKRADGRWEARYTAGFDERTGKQIQKSVYGKTQKEVRQKLTKIESEIDIGAYFEPTRITTKDWLEIWLKEYSFDKKYSTLKTYRAACESHIYPELGRIYIHQLTTSKIQKFYNKLQNPTDDTKPLAPKTVKNIHGILRKSLTQAVKNGYININPCFDVVLPRVEKTNIKPLDDEQVSKLLHLADEDKTYGLTMKIAVLTGMRESEVLGLTWNCVDFKFGTIMVEKQLQRRPERDGGYVFTSLKNDKFRTLKPAPYVMELLLQRYYEQETQCKESKESLGVWMGWKNETEHKEALVFTTAIGEHLNPKRMYLHFKKLAEKIGAPNARVHDLRHTYAVLSLQNGDDVKTVQGNLGHSSAAFTLDRYGHISSRMKEESSKRMEQYVQSILNL